MSRLTLVRRLDTTDCFNYYPDTVSMLSAPKGDGWDGYLTGVGHFLSVCVQAAEVARQAGQLKSEYVIQAFYRATMGEGDPCLHGVGPDGVDYICDEKIEVLGDGDGFKFRVDIYAPDSADKLPGGTRLPVTSIDKLTHEAGHIEIEINRGSGKISASGSGAPMENPQVREALEVLNTPGI